MLNDFYRGDSKTLTIRINSLGFDAGTCWLTLKKSVDDADADAVLQKTGTFSVDPDDASKVMAEIYISPAETDALDGKYYYDIQAVSDDGTAVITAAAGKVKAMKDVTRSVINV